jgi:hypothetical protein
VRYAPVLSRDIVNQLRMLTQTGKGHSILR